MFCFIPISCTSNELPRRSLASLGRRQHPAVGWGTGSLAERLGEEHSTGWETGDRFSKQQNRHSPTKTDLGKHTHFTTEGFTFAVISCAPPPTIPHSASAISSSSLRSPTAPAHGSSPLPTGSAPTRDTGALSPQPSRASPLLERLFASDPSAPRSSIYKATVSPPLFRYVWRFSTSTVTFGG